jgi:hypothetical protein
MKDRPNFGYCADGKKVSDTTKCPEKSKKYSMISRTNSSAASVGGLFHFDGSRAY